MTSAPRRDLARELNDFDGRWPDAWKPKPGETLIGRVLLYSTGQSSYGPVRTAIIQTDAGAKVSLWLSSTVLLSLFQRERPQVGERIGLKYCGKHETKGYRIYTLIVDRPAAEQAFTPLGGEAGDDPEPYAAATIGAATIGRPQQRVPVTSAGPALADDDPFDF